MKKKYEEEMVNGVGTGNFKLVEASVVDMLNPLVPVDAETGALRTIGFALLTAFLSK